MKWLDIGNEIENIKELINQFESKSVDRRRKEIYSSEANNECFLCSSVGGCNAKKKGLKNILCEGIVYKGRERENI